MAKLDARRLSGFLADPGECRLAVLVGDDAGLIRERAGELVRAVTRGDDLCLVEPTAREAAKDTGLMAAEAATLPLTGGRRAVWVRDGGDSLTEGARLAAQGRGPGLVVIEAPGLARRNKLYALAADSAAAALIECWRETGAQLVASAGRMLRDLGAEAEPAALELLADRAGEDRLLLKREVEKLALHAGAGQRVTAEDVIAVVAEAGGLDVEEAVMAALLGDVATADRALNLAMAEGANPVQVIRAGLRHVQRLHALSLQVAEGTPPGEAVNAFRPPVFWKQKAAVERALRRWSTARLEAAGSALLRAERQAKSTGLPDATIARHTLLAIARAK
ncbi:MAG: DNA polymerase III subunit delta [Acetobacteraceae bacterium]|nr:DNA polymerase III subunit delta [Acetobacteraceae bacterium]